MPNSSKHHNSNFSSELKDIENVLISRLISKLWTKGQSKAMVNLQDLSLLKKDKALYSQQDMKDKVRSILLK